MVTIILPTFNRAQYLRDTVASVLQQTDVDFELIVVDDGSEDNTGDILSSFRDQRIKYYRQEHTGYIGQVRNFAMERASGEFLAFIDSDDLWTPGKLARQVQLLTENPDLGFSLTDITVFKGDTVLKEYTYRHRNTVQHANIFNWITDDGFLVYKPTLVMRKSCLGLTGLHDESSHAGCLGFNMRLAYHFTCGVIFEPLLLRRLHDSNHSEEMGLENYSEFLDVYQQLYTDNMITKSRLHKARGNAFFKIGEIKAAEGKFREARRNYFLSLENDIFHSGSFRSLLKSWWANSRY